MQAKVSVNMLGGLSVRAGNQCIIEASHKVNKPWQVLCYLVLHRDKPSPPAQLIEALWPEESLADPNNVLKNTVYALRREFKDCEGEAAKPVLFQRGGYICNPDVEFTVDVEEFERYCEESSQQTGQQRAQVLQQAMALYGGDLLPPIAQDAWLAPRHIYLKKLHIEAADRLCRDLYKLGLHSELLAEATAAGKIAPEQECFYLHTMRALYELGMYQVIIPLYQKTSRLFAEEMGKTLSPEIREIYAAASEKVNPIEQDILSIRDDLREVSYDGAPTDGPLYCTYDVFKYLYQMVARTAERTGALILIVLVSLQEADGGPPTEKALSTAMETLKNGLLGGLLRKSDTVARYSKSQYILMLSSDQANGSKPVVERIRKNSEERLAKEGLRILFATTELDPQTL